MLKAYQNTSFVVIRLLFLNSNNIGNVIGQNFTSDLMGTPLSAVSSSVLCAFPYNSWMEDNFSSNYFWTWNELIL